MTEKELGKLLYDNGVYDSLQFILSAQNSIIDACYSKDIILGVNKSIIKDHEDWRNSWLLDSNGKVIMGEAPRFLAQVFDIEISKLRFRDMLIKTFFQSCRNALDAMAQAANAGCLAFKAKRIETVDFCSMKKTFQQETYRKAFPTMYSWFVNVDNAGDYKYIDMYCNRTKHTCTVDTKSSFALLGNEHSLSIEPFSRKEIDTIIQNNEKQLPDYMPQAYEFICDVYRDFVQSIAQEVRKKTYVTNRYCSVSVFQRVIMQNTIQTFSFGYINADTDITQMPEEIQVLLLKENENGEIEAKNSPFEIIYVNGHNENNKMLLVGKYVAEEEKIGEDRLLRFRKYKKMKSKLEDAPLLEQAMTENKQIPVFFGKNSYFENITTDFVNDDT